MENLKNKILNNWENLLLLFVVWIILSVYTDLFKNILEASQLAKCVSNDKNTMEPCKILMNLAGRLIFLFGFISIALLIFKEQKENIIKILFVYFSAATLLYTSGIGYTDIEQQKVQLQLNQEYYTANQENELLYLYKNNKKNDFENNLKIRELEISIANRTTMFQVLQEQAKLYLQYRVTASFAIIVLSYILLMILLLQLNISKLKIIGVLILLLFLAYPNY
jgi:hypothetical protein